MTLVNRVAALLLAKGANANAMDSNGLTPLQWAIRRDDKEMIELLRQQGAKE